MLDMLKAAASKVSDTAGHLAANGAEKLNQAMTEIQGGLALLRSLGSTVGEMEVRLGLMPSVTLNISRSAQLDAARLEALKQEYAEQKYIGAMLAGMLIAERMADGVQTPGQRLNGYKIELSVPPSVTLVYSPAAAAESLNVAQLPLETPSA